MNDWNKAEKDLKKAMRLNPDDPYILNYLAYSWLDRNKNVEKALSLLKKAVEIEPDDAYIIDSLGGHFSYQIKPTSRYFSRKSSFNSS